MYCRFERLEVHQTCIYSKMIIILMPKVAKPAYTQKNKKSQTLCGTDWHRVSSSPSNLHILKKIKRFDSEKSPNLHILKKTKNLRLYVGLTGIESPQAPQTCIYSKKKSNVLIVKSHQTCIYSTKILKTTIHLCQSVPHRV